MAPENHADPAEPGKSRLIYRDRNMQVVFAVSFISMIGITSITPAFPKIIQELHISAQEVGLLISVFTGPAIVTTLIFGALGDLAGRKKILVPALFLFGALGGACAFTSDFSTLLVLRFLQGICSSVTYPIGAAILCDSYAGNERTAAMGYNGSAIHLGNTIYPALGGALALFAWNYPFLLSVSAIPIGVFVMLRGENTQPKCQLGFKEYIASAFHSMRSLTVLQVFAIMVILFIVSYGAYLTYLPFLLAQKFDASSFTIGLVIFIMYLTSTIAALWPGKIAKRISERKIIEISLALFVPALVLITFAPSIEILILPAIVVGFAWGICLPTTGAIMGNLAPAEHRAIFMAGLDMSARVGQTLGPIIMAVALGAFGINGVFFAAAGFSLCLLVAMLVTRWAH